MRANQSICPTCGTWDVSVLIDLEGDDPAHYTCRVCRTEWDRLPDDQWSPGDP